MAVTVAQPETPGRNTVARSSTTTSNNSNTNNSPVRERGSQMKTPESKFINSLNDGGDTPSTSASTPSSSPSNKASSTAAASSGRKQFYAIRKGRGVSHCIFSSWDHAKQHVENCRDSIYNVFDKMEDAMMYIQLPSRKTTSASKSSTSSAASKRKRTSTLPFSYHSNNKKSRAAKPTTSAMDYDKENQLAAATAMTNAANAIVPRPSAALSSPFPQLTRTSSRKASFVAVDEALEDYPIDDDEEEEEEQPIKEDGRDLPDILEEGYRRDLPKGWRANDLFPARRQDRVRWENRYLEDVASLKAYRATKPSSARDVHNMRHESGIPNAFSLAYLNWSWGVGEAYHRYLAFQQRKNKPESNKHRTKNNKLKVAPANRSNHYSCSTCVITNREAARKRFTARAMFYSFRVQQLAEMHATGLTKDQLPGRMEHGNLQRKSPLVNGCSRSKELMDEARADWEMLCPEDRAFWIEQERDHDARQPEIRRILEQALARDPKRSAKKLSEDINFWCGKTTIGKWKNLRIGPSYRKGISQAVSRANQKEHMAASTATNSQVAAVSVTHSNLPFSPPHISAAKLLVALPDVNQNSFADEEQPCPAPCLSYNSISHPLMEGGDDGADNNENMII